ncbi:MAG: hypothetical protein GXP40_04205 [Chloroflexi bacterium]|nr:hypothetical protein [Chloroflexota bacterium]
MLGWVAEVRHHCSLDETGENLARSAMSQLQLSARGCHRALKLARTTAGLAEEKANHSTHSAEALQYRPKGMMGRDMLISGTSRKTPQNSIENR